MENSRITHQLLQSYLLKLGWEKFPSNVKGIDVFEEPVIRDGNINASACYLPNSNLSPEYKWRIEESIATLSVVYDKTKEKIIQEILAFGISNFIINSDNMDIDPMIKEGLIPKEQFNFIVKQPYVDADIDISFLGFTGVYKQLLPLIPKHFTVIDLGCAYAPQCFYFKDHKKYIGVDIAESPKFHAENSEFFTMSIKDFCEKKLSTLDLNLEETFAICSYVPSKEVDIARQYFKNIFVYYPHGENINVPSFIKTFEGPSR